MKRDKIIHSISRIARERYFLLKRVIFPMGTTDWLIGTEIKYGGKVANVPRRKLSPKDPRTKKQLLRGGMTGGDRMLYHGYAQKYSEYLLPYVKEGKPLTLTEFGILKGTGLAIWCDLFPKGKILGFDIDLSHTNDNMNNLKKLGAFKNNQPEFYQYDMYLDNTKYLGRILKGKKIDVCIDDGSHVFKTILNTMKSVIPYLAGNFAYFVEDNKTVHKRIKTIYPDLTVDSQGALTIVSRKKAA